MNEIITNNILRKNAKRLLLFLIGITIVVTLSIGTIFTYHINYISDELVYNIKEYGEIDREQLCKLSKCHRVDFIKENKFYLVNSQQHLIIDDNHEYLQNYNFTKNIYVDKDFNIKIFNKESQSYYYLNTTFLKHYGLLIISFIIFLLFLFTIPLYFSIKEEQKETIIMLAGNEALLANKSMINIAENIHHELNTPLEVIDNKVEKIHRILNEVIVDELKYTKDLDMVPEDRIKRNKKLIDLEEDFEFIKLSGEQIYGVLDKMKSFKHLRYSNGNKSIFDIFEGAFKIINISNGDFWYKIDERLNNYSLLKLKNAELLSIIINHIKNSLEANADKIFISFTTFNVIDKIFKANYSTKNDDYGVRGNGMYLNKYILNNVDGDVHLIETSKKGTTMELIIPSKER